MNESDNQRFEKAGRYLRVLGHPMRLAMVEALRSRPWCVCELASFLGLQKSVASKHLAQLRKIGVVGMEKEGTQVNCTLLSPCVFDMMRCANFLEGPMPEETHPETCAGGCCSRNEEKI